MRRHVSHEEICDYDDERWPGAGARAAAEGKGHLHAHDLRRKKNI